MSIEAAVFDRLRSELGIDTYAVVLPPGVTLPACRFARVATAIEYTHSGDALLERILWQMDIWAATYAEVSQQADTLRVVWSGYTGQVYEGPDIYIRAALVMGRRDLYDAETNTYRVSMDISMWVQTIE